MKFFVQRILKLLFGLVLYAVGIALTVKANVGYAPWDIFHAGLADKTGLAFGTVSIVVGLVLLLVTTLGGEKLGLGTVLNVVAIGVLIDMIFAVMPKAPNTPIGILMLLAGLWIIVFATWFYIDSGFGAGPRDALMVFINRKTGLSVGLVRSVIELIVAAIGWLLGGFLGLGTVITVIAIGPIMQLTFKFLRFQPAAVKHETLADTVKFFVKK